MKPAAIHVSGRNAINFASLQLLKEAAHNEVRYWPKHHRRKHESIYRKRVGFVLTISNVESSAGTSSCILGSRQNTMRMRSALRLASIVLGACAWIGLAILGWCGFGRSSLIQH